MSDVTEINVETGEITSRPYTNEEIQNRNNMEKPEGLEPDQTEILNYLVNKQSALIKLQQLGLTEEEARAIAGI